MTITEGLKVCGAAGTQERAACEHHTQRIENARLLQEVGGIRVKLVEGWQVTLPLLQVG